MLFLLVRIADARFAIEARRIVEILPLLDVQRFVREVAGITGVLDYRSGLIPVIDLAQIGTRTASARRFGTRIVVVRGAGLEGAAERVVGLIAEGATELATFDPGEFQSAGLATQDPYAGPIARDPGGSVRRLDLERLISSALASPGAMAGATS